MQDEKTSEEAGETRPCASCDENVAVSAKFCPYCGSKVPAASDATEASSETQIWWQPAESENAGQQNEAQEAAKKAAQNEAAEPEEAGAAGGRDVALSDTLEARREDGAGSKEQQADASESAQGVPEDVEALDPVERSPEADASPRRASPANTGTTKAEFELDTSEFTGPKRLLGAGLVAAIVVAALAMGQWVWRSATAGAATADGEAIAAANEDPTDGAEHEGADGEGTNARADATGSLASRLTLEVGTAEAFDHEMATIRLDDEPFLRLYTSDGTHHETLRDRAQTVMMRLSWVAERHRAARRSKDAAEEPEFHVRRKGASYEVQWEADGAEPVTVVAIGREDLHHWRESGRQAEGRAELAREIARRVEALLEGSDPDLSPGQRRESENRRG